MQIPQTTVLLNNLWYIEVRNIGMWTYMQCPQRSHPTECTWLKEEEPREEKHLNSISQDLTIFNPFVTSGTYMSHLQGVFSSLLG